MRRHSSWWGFTVVTAITVLAVLTGVWFVGRSETPTAATAGSAVSIEGVSPMPRPGETAPEADALGLGEGVPVWLVFMATWCQECRVETPDVEEASVRGDVRVVAVFVGEDEETVADYAERLFLTIETMPDAGSAVSARYGVRAVPTHVFVGGDGLVREVAFGALSAKTIGEKLDALVAG